MNRGSDDDENNGERKIIALTKQYKEHKNNESNITILICRKDNDDSSDDDSDSGGEDNTRRREGIYNDDDDDSLSGLPDLQSQPSKSTCCSLKMADKPPAGSFFHEVPLSDDSSSSNEKEGDDENNDIVPDFDESISQLIRKRREPPLASRPSTIDGVPTEKAGTGFGKPQNNSSTGVTKEKPTTKPYVAIGEPDNKQQPINDPSKPERDDQGYTLYTDTETGKKSRVFEALIEYPSIFTMVRLCYMYAHVFFFCALSTP